MTQMQDFFLQFNYNVWLDWNIKLEYWILHLVDCFRRSISFYYVTYLKCYKENCSYSLCWNCLIKCIVINESYFCLFHRSEHIQMCLRSISDARCSVKNHWQHSLHISCYPKWYIYLVTIISWIKFLQQSL